LVVLGSTGDVLAVEELDLGWLTESWGKELGLRRSEFADDAIEEMLDKRWKQRGTEWAEKFYLYQQALRTRRNRKVYADQL
jgi:hypothetical protein